jgi:hypothetical protein
MKLKFDLWFERDRRPTRWANVALMASALACAAAGWWYLTEADQLAQARETLWRQQQEARAAQRAAAGKPVVVDDAAAKANAAAQRAITYDWNPAFDAVEQGWSPGWTVVSFEHNAATGLGAAVVEASLPHGAGELKLNFQAPWEIVSIENRVEAGIVKTQVRLRAQIQPKR